MTRLLDRPGLALLMMRCMFSLWRGIVYYDRRGTGEWLRSLNVKARIVSLCNARVTRLSFKVRLLRSYGSRDAG